MKTKSSEVTRLDSKRRSGNGLAVSEYSHNPGYVISNERPGTLLYRYPVLRWFCYVRY
jgi:hypothetical protein